MCPPRRSSELKEAGNAAVDYVDLSAKAAGSINTIGVEAEGRLCGHNTDVDGISAALAGRELAGASVSIIGAGGAARAAMHVLRAAHVADIAIVARTVPRAEALLAEFGVGGRAYRFDDGEAALEDRPVVDNEIGRAAGREGVCQYGWIA